MGLKPPTPPLVFHVTKFPPCMRFEIRVGNNPISRAFSSRIEESLGNGDGVAKFKLRDLQECETIDWEFYIES